MAWYNDHASVINSDCGKKNRAAFTLRTPRKKTTRNGGAQGGETVTDIPPDNSNAPDIDQPTKSPNSDQQTKKTAVNVSAGGGSGGSGISISTTGSTIGTTNSDQFLSRRQGPENLAVDDATGGSFGQTLAALDFSSIIGGPLVAAINATGQAAMTTAQYIMTIGFTGSGSGAGNNILNTVTFNYTAYVNNSTQSNQVTPVSASITVPLLSMLPIPYLRIDSMTIDFKVQLQAMNMVTNTNTFGTTSTVSGGTGGFLSLFETAQFQVTVADTNMNTAVSQQMSNYSLDVTVHAGVDPMPAGMQQVLNIFNSTIVQQQRTSS
jgi:hypothetical protein